MLLSDVAAACVVAPETAQLTIEAKKSSGANKVQPADLDDLAAA
jgi:hypothetical protein